METALSEEHVRTIVRMTQAAYPEVEAVYLYGSAASGMLSGKSDVDVALVLPPADAREEGTLAMSDLRFRLEQTLGRPVDLVNARLAPAVLQKEIVAGGTLLFVGDRGGVDEYEMIVLSLYGKLNEERRGILKDFEKTGRAYRV